MVALPDKDFLFRLAAAAAEQSLPRFRSDRRSENKETDGFDPVTEADREAERAIRAIIRAEYPDHAILGEEFGETGSGPACWVIDPIDGTRAFISGIPLWGTLIGLTVDGEARIGIMHQPFTGERFWGDGRAAWSDGPQAAGATAPRRLAVAQTRDLAEATLFTTTPRLFKGAARTRFDTLEAAVRLARYGADCYAFAMLAAGQVDLVVEADLKPYDIVALVPLIEQAGGIVTRFDGVRPERGGDIIAAATPELHRAALAILNG